MSEIKELLSRAEKLTEEGRLLLILGRSLKRVASGSTEPLGTWAIEELQELKQLDTPQAKRSKVVPLFSRRPQRDRSEDEAEPLVAIWVASDSYRGEWMSAAVGVDISGRKRLLSFQDGATVNPMICEAMVAELTELGLPGDGAILFVTEGSPILEGTMRLHWDVMPPVAHCQSAVLKSVKAHLQGEKRNRIGDRVKGLWQLGGEQVEDALQELVTKLDRENPGAAERLERSLKATLVVEGLAVKQPLKDHLIHAGCARMALLKAKKWASHSPSELRAGLAAWLGQSRRLQGYKELPKLAETLQELAKKQEKRKEAASSTDAAHQ